MIREKKKIHVGIGFVTGRKNFKSVIKTYVESWNESSLVENKKITLNLFVAYDLKYKATKVSDYKITDSEILEKVDAAHYLGSAAIAREAQYLVENGVVNQDEVKLIFGEGYAMKRNAVLYFAIKQNMDYLIFLDDDEYPVATIKVDEQLFWKGQKVLLTHINTLRSCDVTHGHHCGYISPIPQLHFNEKLSEEEFRLYIESISNDIINWESVKNKMADGGVTYADIDIMNSSIPTDVAEVNGMKFISGANLGINLSNKDKIYPFYNPPGARGEDTFLSTCMTDNDVQKVPCYTFHDGYSSCQNILLGVLPTKLKPANSASSGISKRFLDASIGWIRYKPLLLYITQRSRYTKEIGRMKVNLEMVIPSICKYFGNNEFSRVLKELAFYDQHVEEHFEDFANTKIAWSKIMDFFSHHKQADKNIA